MAIPNLLTGRPSRGIVNRLIHGDDAGSKPVCALAGKPAEFEIIKHTGQATIAGSSSARLSSPRRNRRLMAR